MAQGGEFLVNSYTSGSQFISAVSSDPDGNFVVVWMSSPQDGSLSGCFGQRYDALGVRTGSELRLNTYTTDHQLYPSVTSDGAGHFVAVWAGFGGQDGSSSGVFGQRFDADVIFRDGFQTPGP
jgi:hypothetical protein